MEFSHHPREYEPRRETEGFGHVEVFAVGKTEKRNEDTILHNRNAIVLCDGATDKTGIDFGAKTGGEIASQVAAEAALHSDNTGVELVRDVTAAIRETYARINPNALEDSAYRFATTLVAARVVGQELIVTQVGDSSFRINGDPDQTFTNGKRIDEENAATRKAYIERALQNEPTANAERRKQIIAEGRAAIIDRLKMQHVYQNNPDSKYGYGVIDGGDVPESDDFVKVYTFSAKEVHTIELVSDGFYDAFPSEPTIDNWQRLHQTIHAEDPDKFLKYPSTKANDDASVVIARLA